MFVCLFVCSFVHLFVCSFVRSYVGPPFISQGLAKRDRALKGTEILVSKNLPYVLAPTQTPNVIPFVSYSGTPYCKVSQTKDQLVANVDKKQLQLNYKRSDE